MRRVLPALLLVAAIAYIVVDRMQPVPPATLQTLPLPTALPGRPPSLAWPGAGEAALAVAGVGSLGTHGSGRPVPIASVAKMMTAYVVLTDHPLAPGASGPLIRVSPADVAIYRSDLALGESVAAVRAGEQLSEREALEALLLPSANNVATLLADWDAGSEAAFVAKMNAAARALGLTHTHYADASGFDPATVSTAADQLRLAMRVFALEPVRQIAAMSQARLPVAGVVDNVDAVLGRDGIVGIKTGSTSQALGCFVFAADERVGGRTVAIFGAVLGQPATPAEPSILDAVFHATTTLLSSVEHALERVDVIHRGMRLGSVTAPWGRVAVRSATDASLIGWPGLPVRGSVAPATRLVTPVRAGTTVAAGAIAAGAQRIALRLVTARTLPRPSLGWRLTHP